MEINPRQAGSIFKHDKNGQFPYINQIILPYIKCFIPTLIIPELEYSLYSNNTLNYIGQKYRYMKNKDFQLVLGEDDIIQMHNQIL